MSLSAWEEQALDSIKDGLAGSDPQLAALLTWSARPCGRRNDTPSAALFDRMRGKFPTAAVAILEFRQHWDQVALGSARLTCFVTPRPGGAGRPVKAPHRTSDRLSATAVGGTHRRRRPGHGNGGSTGDGNSSFQ
jgi:hypothetical protein